MSVSSIVARGFGSFGSVNLVTTRGYAISSVVPDPTTTGGYIKPRRRVYTRFQDEEVQDRPRERKPRIRAVPRPLEDNADEVIARATVEYERTTPSTPLAGIESGIDQRRKDDEALMLILLLAE